MADALHDWIPSVIQSVEPFLSTEMDMGTRWSAEIGSQLDETSFGIICVTPENVTAPWLNFEAGALSKSIPGAQAHVVPLLLGFRSPSDLEPPLGQFQAALATEADVRRVIGTINGLATPVLSESRFGVAFDRWWPDLDHRLKAIEDSADTPTAVRDAGDKLDELLSLTRQMMGTQIDAEIDAAERLSGAPSKRVFDQALAGVLRMHGLGRQTIEVGPLSHSHDRVFLVVKDRDISASTVTEVRKELSVTLGAMLGHHVKVIELHRRESTVMPRRTEEPSGEDS
jgi:hypothetical protein